MNETWENVQRFLQEPPSVPEHNPVGEWLGRHLSHWLTEQLGHLLSLLTAQMPDIATVGIVLCGGALMITGDAARWLGRAMLIFWVAVTWLMLT